MSKKDTKILVSNGVNLTAVRDGDGFRLLESCSPGSRERTLSESSNPGQASLFKSPNAAPCRIRRPSEATTPKRGAPLASRNVMETSPVSSKKVGEKSPVSRGNSLQIRDAKRKRESNSPGANKENSSDVGEDNISDTDDDLVSDHTEVDSEANEDGNEEEGGDSGANDKDDDDDDDDDGDDDGGEGDGGEGGVDGKKPRVSWTDHETECFLTICIEKHVVEKIDGTMGQNLSKAKIFKSVACALKNAKVSKTTKTHEHCKQKYGTLRKTYRVFVRGQGVSGAGSQTLKFYDQLYDLFHKRPNVNCHSWGKDMSHSSKSTSDADTESSKDVSSVGHSGSSSDDVKKCPPKYRSGAGPSKSMSNVLSQFLQKDEEERENFRKWSEDQMTIQQKRDNDYLASISTAIATAMSTVMQSSISSLVQALNPQAPVQFFPSAQFQQPFNQPPAPSCHTQPPSSVGLHANPPTFRMVAPVLASSSVSQIVPPPSVCLNVNSSQPSNQPLIAIPTQTQAVPPSSVGLHANPSTFHMVAPVIASSSVSHTVPPPSVCLDGNSSQPANQPPIAIPAQTQSVPPSSVRSSQPPTVPIKNPSMQVRPKHIIIRQQGATNPRFPFVQVSRNLLRPAGQIYVRPTRPNVPPNTQSQP